MWNKLNLVSVLEVRVPPRGFVKDMEDERCECNTSICMSCAIQLL